MDITAMQIKMKTQLSKALVVDNYPDSRELSEIILRGFELDVQSTTSDKAYDLVKEKGLPHYLIVDVSMDTPGESFLEKLAKDQEKVPAIVLSAHAPQVLTPQNHGTMQLAKGIWYATQLYTPKQLKALGVNIPAGFEEIKENLPENDIYHTNFKGIFLIKPYSPTDLVGKIKGIRDAVYAKPQ
jgi:CheY-like chemotaxis protein